MGIYSKFVQACEIAPHKTALIFKGKEYSYRELRDLVDLAAGNLLASFPGCRRVAVNAHNSVELVVLAFALAKLGLTMVPLNPALRRAQLQKQITATCCDVLLTNKATLASWQTSSSTLKVGDIESCLRSLERDKSLERNNSPERKNSHALEVDVHAAYLITLSSGSTGDPKPIVLSQQSKLLRSEQAAASYGIRPEDVVICASPFYHSLGQRLCFLPLLHGATLVLLEHFSVDAWASAVERHQVSFTIAVSSHLQALQGKLLEGNPALRSLRCLVSSSALLTSELKERLFAKLGCEFHEMYGATEVATATNLSPEDARFRPGSVGRALPGVEILILDNEGQIVEANTVGEIACKSPLVFSGYDAKPRETHAAFNQNGFFLTGDLGYLDKDGFLYFVSRKKDIIITGGINVVPRDIETELLKLPEIADCCVIGVEDNYLGEAIVAVCVATDTAANVDAVQRKVQLQLNNVLAGFQQPRHYEFVERIPLIGSGKPDKQSLRARFATLAKECRAHAR